MLISRVTATAALCLVVVACSSPAKTPHTTSASSATAKASSATATASAATATLPAGCAAALAKLPSSPPSTGQQAAAEIAAFGRHKGTPLGYLEDSVAADALFLSFTLAGNGGETATALAKYRADVSALRSYCR